MNTLKSETIIVIDDPPSICDHIYKPIAIMRGINGIPASSDMDKETWWYQCVICGHRFQTDDAEYNEETKRMAQTI